VAQVGAEQTHLILDSCNSYFMVRPRKPGGRPLAVDLAGAGPGFAGGDQVGAFLSTSSEQTVYEWSEIQSGIFSFLVRSGLMGGADANRDGRITYDELRGFVGVASRNVPNPAVRPNVFARAPGGDGGHVLLDLNPGGARALQGLPGGQRFILRNADGFRLAELHPEPSFSPAVRVWGGKGLQLDAVVAPPQPDQRPGRITYDLPDQGPIAFDQLPGRVPAGQTRGSDRMFQALFETPFGPQALARQLDEERRTPPRVYGLARADTDRLRLNLQLLAQNQRDDRLGTALWQGLVASGLTVAAVESARGGPNAPCGEDCRVAAWALGSTAALFGAFTIWNLIPGAMERVADRGRRSAAQGDDPGTWLPELDRDLERLAARTRLFRRITAGGSVLFFGGILAATVGDAVQAGRITGDDVWTFAFWGALGTASTWLVLQESTAERQIRSLKADPLWQGISVAAAPAPGGFRLALRTSF
jgi:hypothetical protein